MKKLSEPQIHEYFTIHLPYRNRILLTHKRIIPIGYYNDCGVLEACFEASLIVGRMYLNLLGISRDKNDNLIKWKSKSHDDITAEDLGGHSVEISNIPIEDKKLFIGFLKMADKASAHLTLPMKHDWENTHRSIDRIIYYLNEYLYKNSNYKFTEKC